MSDSNARDSQVSAPSTYVFDDPDNPVSARFPALAADFDAGTIRHLAAIGVGAGSRCLEVGGGGGSIAAWLSSRVGPTGHVLVTDIDTHFLESMNLPHTEIRRHDIVTDPLPKASFDFVHVRLVLLHVHEREQALANMIAALKPGGWLLGEDFDVSVSPDPSLDSGETLSTTYLAMTRIMTERGVDRMFGRRLFGRFQALGLVDVGAEGRSFMWSAGSPGPALMRTNFEQLRADMIAAGYVTEDEFEHDLAALGNADFRMPSPVLWAAWGRKRADSTTLAQ